ncbi:hypothetical protein AMK21_23145 [Streptomyces sp. CB00316]|nr:hypothetical protein AMK21_23145 [Streptomyces sp. CB00316]
MDAGALTGRGHMMAFSGFGYGAELSTPDLLLSQMPAQHPGLLPVRSAPAAQNSDHGPRGGQFAGDLHGGGDEGLLVGFGVYRVDAGGGGGTG